MRRRRILFEHEPWTVVLDSTGSWQVVNERGDCPLREEDPLARLCNLTLAASAPVQRAALRELLHLARRLTWCYSTQTRRDGRILARAEHALTASRPTEDHLAHALRALESRQLELPFDDAA